jgi:hypothetical protein
MPNENYQITYRVFPPQIFSSRIAAERHIEKEKDVWAGFLAQVAKSSVLLAYDNPHIEVSKQATVFDTLEGALDDPRQFSRLTEHPQSIVAPPPPHESLEGQLILGLFAAERQQEAMAVYIWFISGALSRRRQRTGEAQDLIKRGEELWTAAVAASAFPFNQVSSRKIAGAARRAENQLEALNAEVVKAKAINTAHEETLADYRDQLTQKDRKLVKVIAKRERGRREKHSEWVTQRDAELTELLSKIQRHIQENDSLNEKLQDVRETEFNRLKDLFATQLRLRAPVELWENREEEHRKTARTAMKRFLLSAASALFIGILVPYCAGDYIAESFFTQVCNNAEPPVCERAFSAKGPLTITGLLLVLSLVMWMTRLQYRVFLSERHLSLDAGERKAFAETFLAMKEGEDVGSGNEAIVLASLFRPTQDGIIKDDETGLDLSAAAMVAKQLGKNT